MTIEQLMYIVEVAKLKSLAKAAKTLNITQSGLSQAITKLESELNIKIFERNNTGAETTKEGEKIIERAHNALLAIYQIKEEAHNQLKSSDYLKISTIPGLMEPLIEIYLHIKQNGSNLKIEVIERSSFEIINDIKSGDIHLGFIAINQSNFDLVKELEFQPIIEGELKIFASNDLPSVKVNKQITLDTLKNHIFVLYKDEYVEEYTSALQRVLGPIDILLITTNMELISRAVLELGALTIGHDISSIFNQSNKIVSLNMVDFMDTTFKFGWLKKNDYKLSKESKKYIEKINNLLLNTKR